MSSMPQSAVQLVAEGFSARYRGLAEHLPGTGLAWLDALREDAARSFATQGLPTRKVEAWKYTDLAPLAQADFHEPLSAIDSIPALPPARAPYRAVFVDGRFRDDLSMLPDGSVTMMPLALALPRLRGVLGALAQPAAQPLAALNTMLFEDGLLVEVPEGVRGGAIELLSIAAPGERAIAFHPRHLIRLGAGASLTLIESATGEGRYLHNPVLEFDLGAGAHLTHARLQQDSEAAFHLATSYARLSAGATYDSFVLNVGARLTRNEIHATLAGPGGTCHLNGAQLLDGTRHADTFTSLDHAAPNCASRQTYKTVLEGRSRGVFQGKILVRRAAQKTDGYQMNQALLLSDQAEMDSKPQLEIYADDVKCSHGATVGALDEAQLFYLRTRGVPQAQARAMLVEAFVQEAVDGIGDEVAREAVAAALTATREQKAAA